MTITTGCGCRSCQGGGAGIGYLLDDQDRKILKEVSPETSAKMQKGEPLTVQDVIWLHNSGLSEETIVRYIRDTKTSYLLNQLQIRKLQTAGVSQRVISYMIDTGRYTPV